MADNGAAFVQPPNLVDKHRRRGEGERVSPLGRLGRKTTKTRVAWSPTKSVSTPNYRNGISDGRIDEPLRPTSTTANVCLAGASVSSAADQHVHRL